MRTISIVAGVLGLACLASAGCGKGPAAKLVYGSVMYGDEKVPLGEIFFEPYDERGPNCVAPIVDGQYRIDARGGVPLGKYRIRVDARKKTGRKVMGNVGPERAMIDEEAHMGPAIYKSGQSPLVVDVTADFKGQFDIVIPRKR